MRNYFLTVWAHILKIRRLPLLGILAFILPFYFIHRSDWSKPSIDATGIFFQLIGVTTIALDLLKTQKQYGTFDPVGFIKKYSESAICWFRNFPLPWVKKVVSLKADINVSSETSDVFMALGQAYDIKADNLVEEVTRIAEHLNKLQDELWKVTHDKNKEAKALNSKIEELARKTDQEIRQTTVEIKNVAISGLGFGWVGVIFFMIGIVFSGFSQNISKWFC